MYPGKVEYYSSSSSRANVIKLCKELSDIPYHHLAVVDPHNNIQAVLRAFLSAFQNIRMLLSFKNDDLLFYNYDNVFSLHLINVINKFLKRKIVIVCHGELELLLPEIKGGIFAKMMSRVLKAFFSVENRIDDRINFCVLGKSILHNVCKILPTTASCHFSFFDHPYIYKDSIRKNKKSNVINIGVVGTFSEEKGAADFVWLVQQLNSEKNVSFSITGTVTSRLEELMSLGVSLPSNQGKGLVPRKEFADRLKELDYLLFFYPSDSYKFTASGAIMDAIEWGIPILAIKNDYFSYIFENYGSIGHLVNNKHEMKNLILSLLNKKDDDLEIEFDSIRRSSSPKAISEQLQKIVCNIL